MKVSTAARRGRRQLLESLRDVIAAQIDAGVPARDLAPLTRRIIDIDAELALEVKAAEEDAVTIAARTPDAPWKG